MWGAVTYRKDCQALAPSIWAASYWSRGIVCRAAYTLTMMSGAPNQMLIPTRVGSTRSLLLKNWIRPSVSPRFFIMVGTKP